MQIQSSQGVNTSFSHPILDRAVILLSKRDLFGDAHGEKLGKKLEERFRYFLSSFITSALSHGATVPLSIANDQNASLQTFVKHGGPKHVIHMIKSHLEMTELVRTSFALLIVCVNLLRNKLSDALLAMDGMKVRMAEVEGVASMSKNAGREVVPQPKLSSRNNSLEPDDDDHDNHNSNEDDLAEEVHEEGSNNNNNNNHSNYSKITTNSSRANSSLPGASKVQQKAAVNAERKVLQSTIEWSTRALHHFSDQGRSAAMCVSVLISTVVPSLQELSLTLLGLLVTVCGTSARRLLQPHVTGHDSNHESKRESAAEGARGDGDSISKVNQKDATLAVNQKSLDAKGIKNKRRDKGKTQKPVLEKTLEKAFASTSSFPLIAKRLGVYCPQNDTNLTRKSSRMEREGAGKNDTTCLAYILSVASKEYGSVAMAACAEIVLAISLEDNANSSDSSSETARGGSANFSYRVARTSTCPLPKVEVGSAHPAEGVGHKKESVQPVGASGQGNIKSAPTESEITTAGKGAVEEWMGLKVFLRFLARNIRYFQNDALSDNFNENNALENNFGEKKSKKNSSSTLKNELSAMAKNAELLARGGTSSQQLHGLVYAFHKSIAAVSCLTLSSPRVAGEIGGMHGAEDVLRAALQGLAPMNGSSDRLLSESDVTHLSDLVSACAFAIRQEMHYGLSVGEYPHDSKLSSGFNVKKRPNNKSASKLVSRPSSRQETQSNKEYNRDLSASEDSDLASGGPFGMAIMNKANQASKGMIRPKTSASVQEADYPVYTAPNGHVLAGPGQAKPSKRGISPVRASTAPYRNEGGPQVGHLSPLRKNLRPLSPQFGQKYRSDVSYSMPEFPLRRGLSPKHRSRDDETSLHKVIFQGIVTPEIPKCLEPADVENIAETLQHRDDLKGRKIMKAVSKLESVSKSAEGALVRTGFTFNGQHSIPILERARRVYYPPGQPITFQMQESGDLGTNSNSYVRPPSPIEHMHKDVGDDVGDGISPTSTKRDAAFSFDSSPVLGSMEETKTAETNKDVLSDGTRHKAFIDSMIEATKGVQMSLDNENSAIKSEHRLASRVASQIISTGTENVLSRPTSANADQPSIIRLLSFSSKESTPRHLSSRKVQEQWEVIDRIEECIESVDDILILSKNYVILSDFYLNEDDNRNDAMEMRLRAIQCIESHQNLPAGYLESISQDLDKIRSASADKSRNNSTQKDGQKDAMVAITSVGMQPENFNFEVPGLLEMTPIYAVNFDGAEEKKLESENDYTGDNAAESIVSNPTEQTEEDACKNVVRTQRNVEGLVVAAGKVEHDQKGGLVHHAASRGQDSLEFIFPKK